MLKLLLVTSLLIVHSFAFSSLGSPIKAYGEAEGIPMFAEELTSPKTQVSYDYFYLNFCREGRDNLVPPKQSPTDIGQWTPYGVWTRVSRGCVHLCRRDFSQEDVKKFIDLIDLDYRMNFVIDNLPVLTNGTSDIGLLLGYKKDGKYYINNHLSFRIEINNTTKTVKTDIVQHRVVSFTAAPKSLQTMMVEGRPMGFCENEKSRPLDAGPQEIKAGPIFFSFDLKFFPSAKTVAERDEDYKQLGSDEIHWRSLISSCIVNLGLVVVIRSLLKKPLQNPSKLNSVPTLAKSMPFHVRALSLLQGLLPFASIFIELKYLMISFWQHKFYYLYSYLFAALLLLVITSASVSIIVTYLELSNGKQRSSFWNPGSIGLYVFAYAVFFYFNELDLIGWPAKLTYFGYMLALSLIITVLCSISGYFASSWFIGSVYDSPQALESKQK